MTHPRDIDDSSTSFCVAISRKLMGCADCPMAGGSAHTPDQYHLSKLLSPLWNVYADVSTFDDV